MGRNTAVNSFTRLSIDIICISNNKINTSVGCGVELISYVVLIESGSMLLSVSAVVLLSVMMISLISGVDDVSMRLLYSSMLSA